MFMLHRGKGQNFLTSPFPSSSSFKCLIFFSSVRTIITWGYWDDHYEARDDKDDCGFVMMTIINFGVAYDDGHDNEENEENEDNHPALHYLPGEEDIGGVVQHNLIS